jgi:hypothetical protein
MKIWDMFKAEVDQELLKKILDMQK